MNSPATSDVLRDLLAAYAATLEGEDAVRAVALRDVSHELAATHIAREVTHRVSDSTAQVFADDAVAMLTNAVMDDADIVLAIERIIAGSEFRSENRA